MECFGSHFGMADIELWLDRHPLVMQDIFLRKADTAVINKWLVKNGYPPICDQSSARLSSFSEDSSDPTSPCDAREARGDVFFSKHARSNSKKHLRHDYAKSKYTKMFRTYEPQAVTKSATDERRNSLKEMRMFRSLPPNSSNILSLLIQSKVRLPRYPSKDIDKKREQRLTNEMEFFMDIVKDISNDLNLHSLSEKMVSNISVLNDADHASLFVLEGKNNNTPSLVSKLFDVHSGTHIMPTNSTDNCVRVPWGKGIIGYVAEHGETVNLIDAHEVSNEFIIVTIIDLMTVFKVWTTNNPIDIH